MYTSGKQAAVISVLLAGAFLAQTSGQTAPPAQTPTPTPAAPPIRLALTSLKPDAVIEVGADPHITVAGDAVWIVNRSAGTLRKVDSKTNAPGAPIATDPSGKGPCQPVVSAFRSLWIAFCDSKRLYRADPPVEKPSSDKPAPDKPATDKPATEKPTTEKPATEKPAAANPVGEKPPVPKSPATIAVEIQTAGPLTSATGSIWMITNTAGTLARIDPDTNAAVAEIHIPGGAIALASGMNAIWLVSATGDSVTRVHAETNVVEETIKVGRRPLSVAIGEGSVWTMNGGDGTVSRIDAKTNKVIETINSGVIATSGTIVIGEGSVWLSAPGIPLTRIDPSTNRMVQQFTGPGGGLLAIGLKSLWLGATPTAIWRIDPKRVEATRK
jgi:virginiamycin B lyase